MLLWLLHHLTLLARRPGGVGEDHAARCAGRRAELRRGRAAGPAMDRLAATAGFASRSRATRPKSSACTATSRPRRRWADCSSSPPCWRRVLLFGDLQNGYVAPALLVAGGMTLVGIVDDLVKLRSAANGISARYKLAAQLVVAGVAAVLLYQQQAAVADGLLLRVPLLEPTFSLGLWFIPLAVVVIVGASNAVNLTDGLDGLAGGCLIAATAAMTGLVYAAGHAEWAAYLGVPRIPHAGEMTVLAGAMIGGVLGFLWFNCHPAQVFMGNTGALPLGGLLGVLAVVARQELLLVVDRRRVRRRGGKRDPPGRLLQVAAAAIVALRAAAPPFSVPRLARKQDRRPLLDRRGAVRLARRRHR